MEHLGLLIGMCYIHIWDFVFRLLWCVQYIATSIAILQCCFNWAEQVIMCEAMCLERSRWKVRYSFQWNCCLGAPLESQTTMLQLVELVGFPEIMCFVFLYCQELYYVNIFVYWKWLKTSIPITFGSNLPLLDVSKKINIISKDISMLEFIFFFI